METKKQVKNYARYTMLKIILYVLQNGTVIRMSKCLIYN